MVIREYINGIQKLPRLTTDHNTKANNTSYTKIPTRLSTLRCYNFNVDKDEAESSTFMISIEDKLPCRVNPNCVGRVECGDPNRNDLSTYLSEIKQQVVLRCCIETRHRVS